MWAKAIAGAVTIFVIAWATGFWDTTKVVSTRLWWMLSPPASAIYVESPEVYTRERLINERSTEEAWLNDQLKLVDRYVSRANIINKLTDSTSITAGTADAKEAGEGDQAEPPAAASATASSEEASSEKTVQSLTFDQNFKLLSAYRNLIRQRMIENRLDDRHDLEGNSLYILKFDSTVLGVPSLNERAVIQVRILPPTELTRLTARDAETILGAVNSRAEILTYTQANYNNWKESLSTRMNAILNANLREFKTTDFAQYPGRSRMLERLSHSLPPEVLEGVNLEAALSDFARGATPAINSDKREAILAELISYFGKIAVASVTSDDILDINTEPPSSSHQSDKRNLVITTPLSRDYFSINLQYTLGTLDSLIDVAPLISYAYITDEKCNWEQKRAAEFPDYFPEAFGTAILWQHYRLQIPGDTESRAAVVAAAIKQEAASGISSSILRLTPTPELFPGCNVAMGITYESGLINFARKIGRFNTYSYSVLPRESPISVYNEIALTTKAAASIENARVGRTQESETSNWELRPVLSTFGDTVRIEDMPGQPTEPDNGVAPETEPVVGWVIDLSAQATDNKRLMSPMTVNESVVAIVSVPAWWPELVVKIDRGWLNSDSFRDQSLHDESPVTYSVKLPNRPEMLDTLLFGSEGRQPVIQTVDTNGASAKNGCEELSVLVTGPRLWRNTAVTIGSAKADEIEVLPNMEGIIAKFRTGNALLPNGETVAPHPVPLNIRGKLRVWTSDGVSETPQLVELTSPAGC
ncbi:MAG: hypothetical protein JNJ53_10095 [Rhizobiales bacterium]|nr:hypothetical protein [Hyphomicrobiales bacterium]